jgi:hypothetical protein
MSEVQEVVRIRPMRSDDLPGVVTACEHSQGNWTPEAFQEDPNCPKYCAVLEDDKGPIVFVRFQKSLRVSCVWVDGLDRARNAAAVRKGLQEACELARANGFVEVIVEATSDNLKQFLATECGMTPVNGEMVISL